MARGGGWGGGGAGVGWGGGGGWGGGVPRSCSPAPMFAVAGIPPLLLPESLADLTFDRP